MAGIHFLALDPILLEHIITKVAFKSYVRLQRSCRYIYELVQNNKNIRVLVYGRYTVLFKKKTSSWQYSYYHRSVGNRIVDVKNLYGTRTRCFDSPDDLDTRAGFEELCDSLKRNRITCAELSSHRAIWTTEQYIKLLNILKPTTVTWKNDYFDRYEALFQTKTLKKVVVFLTVDTVLNVAERFLSTFQEVKIIVTWGIQETFNVLRTVLQILHSTSLPNLHGFQLLVEGKYVQAKQKMLKKEFPDINLTVCEKKSWQGVTAMVEMPQQSSYSASCKIVVDDHCFYIYYKSDRARRHHSHLTPLSNQFTSKAVVFLE